MVRRRGRLGDEAGFSILESTIALSVVFVVLIALLGALTSGARGLVTGRQRSAALALANEVIEDARGRAYGDVGHDLDDDPTLAGDPDLEYSAPDYLYKGVTPAEPLAASAVDAGNGTVNNPLYPFSPHRFTTQRESTVYTTHVYVTTVTPASGDLHKRITVKVTWAPAQYATAARSVVISTLLFNAVAPPDPKLVGTAEADAGIFKVTGTVAGISLSDLAVAFPYARGEVDSGFVRKAKSLSRSATGHINLQGGLVPGCCDGAKAAADADNDSGTAPPDTDEEANTSGWSSVSASPLDLYLGAGSATAQASARSCLAACGYTFGDDDRLPFVTGRSSGSDNASVWLLGLMRLMYVGFAGCSSSDCTRVTVDRDDSGSNQLLTSTATVAYPALRLMRLVDGLGVPGDFRGMVRIDPVTVTATAHSGPAAVAPTVTSPPVTVRLWDMATGSYRTVTFNAGDDSPATDPTASATFNVYGLYSVEMDATVHWNPAVASQSSLAGAVTEASASLTNWLWVDLQVRITTLPDPLDPLLPVTEVANLNLNLDYGRVAATAGYQPIT